MTPETKVKNQVVNLLKKEGLFFERRQAGGGNYKSGIPDLFFVINGKHVEVELKKEKNGILSTLQLYWKDYFERKKITYLLINNVCELEDFLRKENER